MRFALQNRETLWQILKQVQEDSSVSELSRPTKFWFWKTRGRTSYRLELLHTTKNWKLPPGIAPYHPELQATAWNCSIPLRIGSYRLELLHTVQNWKLPPGFATRPSRIASYRLELQQDHPELEATAQIWNKTIRNWKLPPGFTRRPSFFHF